MADKTKIEWTDATWNPITGCSVASPGCTNCYAMKLAGTRLAHHESRAGLTVDGKTGPVWTGEVRFNEQWLDQPLRWRKPRMIFVCAHGDLFHENVPDEWIDRVFAVMALCPQHTFQVLTKRSARMRDYLATCPDGLRRRAWQRAAPGNLGNEGAAWFCRWPLPNVWLGVSVEDQKRADERIPDLLETPAAVRWLSCEPLLGPVDLAEYLICPNARDGLSMDPSTGAYECCTACDWTGLIGGIHWIVCGGESGQEARPMHPDWARSLRYQCAAAGVPFHFKQWGAWASVSEVEGAGRHHRFPDGATVRMVGKKRAGRMLDGVQHDGWPK